jgi:hypothetical protein
VEDREIQSVGFRGICGLNWAGGRKIDRVDGDRGSDYCRRSWSACRIISMIPLIEFLRKRRYFVVFHCIKQCLYYSFTIYGWVNINSR